MTRRIFRNGVLVSCLLFLLGGGVADAGYRLPRYLGLGPQEGAFVFAEGGLGNVRNSDTVVATAEGLQDFVGGVNFTAAVVPDWDDEFTGRLGFGYQWANGHKIVASVWSFETEQILSGDGPLGGALHFAVGPPIFTAGDYVGDSGDPGFYDITSEITATTADLAWATTQEVAEGFELEWSVGLRYANFEETLVGVYDDVASTDLAFGQDQYQADKTSEGEMIGARASVRGVYRFSGSFSAGAAIGFSFLDGEMTGSSSLVPTGVNNSVTTPASLATIDDDGRSGTIRDLEVTVTYHLMADRLHLWLGWEQSNWEEIASDRLRSFAGTVAPLSPRDSVTFSSYKLGVLVRF